jgi:4-hydroxy-3-methylbut-2-enyl diphosphate reductase IspH
VETVGISGATSTPQWLMERIRETIESRFAVAQPAAQV